MSRYTPEVAACARRALVKMRARLPGAVELVYDNYNALVIGFGPSERASEAIFSIALYPRWVNLFFLDGAKLSDPGRRLRGAGKLVRSIVLSDASELDDPEIRKLIDQAVRRAKTPIDGKARRRLVIRSISAKQRPRRPLAKPRA
ncbi:MAG: hypothetical protein ACXVZJ_06940 [Terriglobales bacterium]